MRDLIKEKKYTASESIYGLAAMDHSLKMRARTANHYQKPKLDNQYHYCLEYLFVQQISQQLKDAHIQVNDEDLKRISAESFEHINPLEKYTFDGATEVQINGLRALRPQTYPTG